MGLLGRRHPFFLASTPRAPAWSCPLLPRHIPSDQTVCDRTRKLAKGNTSRILEARSQQAGTKAFPWLHSREGTDTFRPSVSLSPSSPSPNFPLLVTFTLDVFPGC